MKKVLFLTAVLAVVLWGCQRPGPQWMIDRAVSHLQSTLSLDMVQKQKFADLVTAVRQVIVEHQKDGAGDRDQIEALLTAPTLDQAGFKALVENRFVRNDATRSQNFDVVIPKLAVFLDSLNPAQKKKLRGEIEQFKERMSRWS